MEYKIVYGSLIGWEAHIQSLLRSGWELNGPLVMDGHKRGWAYQPMIRRGKVEYDIVIGTFGRETGAMHDSLDGFVEEIQARLAEGWELLGQPYAEHYTHFQALVRRSERRSNGQTGPESAREAAKSKVGASEGGEAQGTARGDSSSGDNT